MPPDSIVSSAAAPKDAVVTLAAALRPEVLGTGALAMLRRLDPTRASVEPALHRLLAHHVDDRTLERPNGAAAWTLIVHAMALAAPDALRFGVGLGKPLYDAGYKEGRLVRLLEVRGDELGIVVPRAVRFLVARGQPLDPRALADFVRAVMAGGERAEVQRTRIARDYYRAERDAA